MKKMLIIGLACLFMLTGCFTTKVEYVYPDLPALDVTLPERPTLERLNVSLPVEANRNTVKLISYIESLEVVIQNFQDYYTDLKQIWSNKDAEN